MKNNILLTTLVFTSTLFVSACNTMPVVDEYSNTVDSKETLYVYDDGKMRLDSRYINAEDVVIYSDGQGGEKAAVKVRVPIHSDFYRDSIIVVRVVNASDESVVKNETDELENIN